MSITKNKPKSNSISTNCLNCFHFCNLGIVNMEKWEPAKNLHAYIFVFILCSESSHFFNSSFKKKCFLLFDLILEPIECVLSLASVITWFQKVSAGIALLNVIYSILPVFSITHLSQTVGAQKHKGDHGKAESVIVQAWQLQRFISYGTSQVIKFYNDESWHPEGTFLPVIMRVPVFCRLKHTCNCSGCLQLSWQQVKFSHSHEEKGG